MPEYPRVLIISKTLINDVDSAGASLRSWFGDWPKDRLAQLYSGISVDRGNLSGLTFQLGPGERRFGRLFNKLKYSQLGLAGQPLRTEPERPGNKIHSLTKGVVKKIGSSMIESGVWELMFPPMLSTGLRSLIETFRPSILFAQGFDISFMRLPLMLHKVYGIPICLNIVDDWVEHLYENSLFAPRMQIIVRRTFRRLAAASSLRYTIGDLMAEEYQKRYGLSFIPLMQCDNTARFTPVSDEGSRDYRNAEVIYSGSLSLDRWRSFIHLAEAARILKSEGINIRIRVYAPFVPPEGASHIEKYPEITLHDALPDHKVRHVLSTADVLFLPESFDSEIRSYIKLSVSTKCHLYMMTGRPVLVYGPPEIGTVDYAKRETWGFVVEKEGVEYLVDALRKLLTSKELRNFLAMNGTSVAARNHDGHVIRERLRNDFVTLMNSKQSPAS
jgi:glycosyltransferase involved in cell wall biosynthesis